MGTDRFKSFQLLLFLHLGSLYGLGTLPRSQTRFSETERSERIFTKADPFPDLVLPFFNPYEPFPKVFLDPPPPPPFPSLGPHLLALSDSPFLGGGSSPGSMVSYPSRKRAGKQSREVQTDGRDTCCQR